MIRERVTRQGYDAERFELSLMTYFLANFTNRWSGYFLIRQDVTGNRFTPPMPSAGIEYKLFEKSDLYIKSNISRNYNIPSLNDLYWVPGGNPELNPEESYSLDASLNYSLRIKDLTLGSAVIAYVSKINDWILWRPTNFNFWEAENLAEVLSRGFELQFHIFREINRYQLKMLGSYAFTKTTNEQAMSPADRSRGKQLIYVPRHTGNFSLNVNRKGYYLNISSQFTGKRYTQSGNENNPFEVVLTYYLLNDLIAGKTFRLFRKEAGVRFTIFNLFNTDYQTILSRPMPGRNYSLLMSIRI